jgi:hypothetical protein
MNGRKAMILILVLAYAFMAFAMVSCVANGASVDARQSDKDADFGIVKLFVADGIVVYRFKDAGRYHYFTKASAINTIQSETNGKTTVEWDDAAEAQK